MIEIDRLSKSFATTTGATHQALVDISLTVPEGEFVSILGPSWSPDGAAFAYIRYEP